VICYCMYAISLFCFLSLNSVALDGMHSRTLYSRTHVCTNNTTHIHTHIHTKHTYTTHIFPLRASQMMSSGGENRAEDINPETM